MNIFPEIIIDEQGRPRMALTVCFNWRPLCPWSESKPTGRPVAHNIPAARRSPSSSFRGCTGSLQDRCQKGSIYFHENLNASQEEDVLRPSPEESKVTRDPHLHPAESLRNGGDFESPNYVVYSGQILLANNTCDMTKSEPCVSTPMRTCQNSERAAPTLLQH